MPATSSPSPVSPVSLNTNKIPGTTFTAGLMPGVDQLHHISGATLLLAANIMCIIYPRNWLKARRANNHNFYTALSRLFY